MIGSRSDSSGAASAVIGAQKSSAKIGARESLLGLKRYLCVGGSLDNTWLTLFNDDGGYRHVSPRPARRRGKRPPPAPEAPDIEDYRVLRIADEANRFHEILAVSTISNEQAVRRWKPRRP